MGEFCFLGGAIRVSDVQHHCIFEEVSPGVLLIKLPTGIYDKAAVLLSARNFANCCLVRIDQDEGHFAVYFEVKPGQDIEQVRHELGEFGNEVIEHQIRLDLERRYGRLREIIYERAFQPIQSGEVLEKCGER